jgi:hypothetical protein
MKKKRPTGITYKPKETNVEKLRVFLAKLNKNENGK